MSLYAARVLAMEERIRPADVVDALRALGEPTRLRIVSALRLGELSVTDLVTILGQSQPRVSRHLKLLCDAGIVTRHREGSWAFFSLTSDVPVARLVDDVAALVDADDPTLVRDRERLAHARQRRADDAAAFFERIAPIWDRERALHASDDLVDQAVLDAAGPGPLGRIIDLGTGTGRMIELLAPHADRIVGLDASHSMLSVARSNLDRAGCAAAESTVELRQGDIYDPPFDACSFDLVVIHQVLHYLDDPARAIVEAGRLVSPGGRMIVVDFAPHRLEFLRDNHAHRRLGFDHAHITAWSERAGLTVVDVRHLDPPAGADGLTVNVWTLAR
jgi:ArsR family transcriptional regulator